MKAAETAALTEAATELRDRVIDWNRYPNLARWFRERPPVNVYWLELAALIREAASSKPPTSGGDTWG
jgi:hypothetical protein